jgi:metal-responsive CopG/Arc/MetJ family transcriptional regulator
MRTLVDIPDDDIAALDELSTRRGASRAKVIREAVRDYLVRNPPADRDAAFGIWRGMQEDGLAYQERLRSEW